ncbi:hypothetical protein ACA910_014834 [Epithemia clementina (nom. ined.)]
MSTATASSNNNDNHSSYDHASSNSNNNNNKSTAAKAANASKDVTRRMVCGGLAGMIAKTATNPLERIKILSQTSEAKHGSTSIMGLYRDIIRNEGILGLWAGNGANLLRVFPAKAVVFSSNDFYRQGIARGLHWWNTGHNSNNSNCSTLTEDAQLAKKLSGPWSFLAGGLAGITASVVTYPLDFARGRISGKLADGVGQKKAYGGIVSTVLVTIKDEGFMALYKGVTPTLLGAMPYEGIKFGTVGLLEATFPQSTSLHHQDSHHHNALSPTTRKMLYGATGGVMAGLITYPNDTIRRMLQMQGSRGSTKVYKGYMDCLVQTVRHGGGIPRLYAGVGANLLRMAPNTAIQFGSYEFLKQHTADWF